MYYLIHLTLAHLNISMPPFLFVNYEALDYVSLLRYFIYILL